MIFYYSCTGNTEWAAKRISAATGEELYPIFSTSCNQVFTLKPDESVGFCFPVHAWRPPIPVREFARQCKIANPEGHFCWILCTAGDDIGETVDIMQKDLKAASLHADSAFSLLMPNTYVGLPFMDVDKEDIAAQKKSQSEERLTEYIGHILHRDHGINRLDSSHWPRINSRLLGHWFIKYCMKDSAFTVDGNSCLHCGLCVKSCPVANIKMDAGNRPSWQHNGRCLTCFACYHHCPVKAIQWGKATRHKGQYYMNYAKKAIT